MKNLFTLITTALFCLNLVQCQNFEIVGRTIDSKDGNVSIVNSESPKVLIAEGTVLDGKFTLKGTIESTVLGKVIFKNNEVSYENYFFIEPGTLSVTLKPIKESIYEGIGYAEIEALSGTPNNNILSAFKTTVKSFDSLPELKSLNKAQQELIMFDQSGNYDPEARKEVYAKVAKASSLVIKILEDNKMKFFMDTKGSLGALYLIVAGGSGIENTSYTLIQKRKLLKHVDDEARASIYYDILEKHVNRIASTEVGQSAPVFTLKNEKGEAITLESLKGKYILLDFWAYYCAPCIAAFPKLNVLYEKYKQNGFEIISISRDLDDAKWLNALKKHKNPWIQLIDEAENGDKYQPLVSNKFSVKFMPTYILIDKEGKILLYTLEEKEIEGMLETIFNANKGLKN